jgi:hypothetical protein
MSSTTLQIGHLNNIAANFNLLQFDIFSMFLVTFVKTMQQSKYFLIDISHQITAHRCCEQLHSSLISSIRFCAPNKSYSGSATLDICESKQAKKI